MPTGVRSRPVGHRWPGGFAFGGFHAVRMAWGGLSGGSDSLVGGFPYRLLRCPLGTIRPDGFVRESDVLVPLIIDDKLLDLRGDRRLPRAFGKSVRSEAIIRIGID